MWFHQGMMMSLGGNLWVSGFDHVHYEKLRSQQLWSWTEKIRPQRSKPFFFQSASCGPAHFTLVLRKADGVPF